MNWKSLKNLDKDELLALVGLETRRDATDYLVPALTAFSVGVLVGAGIGLLLAPKSGQELRQDLKSRLQSGEPLTGGLAGASEKSSPRTL